MELLVCVLNREEKLEAVLARFLQIGVTGATVIESRGMGQLLEGKIPAFGTLQNIASLSRDKNVTVFSVVQNSDILEAARQAVVEICGDLAAPSTGIVFSVPVSSVAGIAPDTAAADAHNQRNGE